MAKVNSIKIYTPTSVLRRPLFFVQETIGDLAKSFHIAWAIFLRDFSAKYRQTFTGYLGALFPVIMTTISFVFLQKMNVLNFKKTGIDYASFVFINTIFWELFSESIQGPTRELQNNISSVIRLNFPREAIFFASVLNVLTSFLIKVGIAFLAIFFLDIKFTIHLLWLFPITIGLLSIGLLLGLLVLPISILFSDFKVIVEVVLKLLFFLTPIAYEIDYSSKGLGWISNLNILAIFFNAIKESVFVGIMPSQVITVLLLSISSVLFVAFGWVVYRVSLPILVERMPS